MLMKGENNEHLSELTTSLIRIMIHGTLRGNRRDLCIKYEFICLSIAVNEQTYASIPLTTLNDLKEFSHGALLSA